MELSLCQGTAALSDAAEMVAISAIDDSETEPATEAIKDENAAESALTIEEFAESLTYKDFQDGLRPCQYIYIQKDPFAKQRALSAICEKAKQLRFSGFKRLYDAFEKMMRENECNYQKEGGNSTNFHTQPVQLLCGDWIADDTGVYREGDHGTEAACTHPILITARLENVDTGEEKVIIAFKRCKTAPWRTIVVDKLTISSATKIVELSSQGILVNSENARLLIRYLADLDSLNYVEIPIGRSISRLGWYDGFGFAPYVGNLVFDAESGFRDLFQAIRQQGDYAEWREMILDCMEYRTEVKILIAASFAAPLLHALDLPCFFVHLWGVRSGSGKTVALRLAASVWADSRPGKYLRSFDSTAVGMEKLAGFLNQLPICIDELQLSRDRSGQVRMDPYKLAEGIGRTRGTKSGGLSKSESWCTTFLTTGETPMNSETAAAGAVNRVIELKCDGNGSIIEDCGHVCEVIARSFGHAGQAFVGQLYPNGEVDPSVRMIYNSFLSALRKTDASEKQMVAATVILTASTLADKWIFGGASHPLTVEETLPYLAKMRDVSVGPRAYDYVVGWISCQLRHFDGTENVDVFGDYVSGEPVCYINRNIFNKIVKEGEFDEKAILSYMRSEGLLHLNPERKERGFTVMHRIGRDNVRCVPLRMPIEGDGGETDSDSEEELLL